MRNQQLQIVIAMAAVDQRYKIAGCNEPRQFLEIDGRPMLAHFLDHLPSQIRCLFVISDDLAKNWNAEARIRQLVPDAKVISMPEHQRGVGYTIHQAIPHLDPNLPVLTCHSDFSLRWSFTGFLETIQKRNLDACIVSYDGFHPHYIGPVPYTYSRYSGNLREVAEVKEKGWFTSNREQEPAACGLYYFSSAKLLAENAARASQAAGAEGVYYLSAICNELIRAGGRIGTYYVPFVLQWASPQDLAEYRYWTSSIQAWIQQKSNIAKIPQYPDHSLLLPMAGIGARFQQDRRYGDVPKPLLPIDGQPMFAQATSWLPKVGRRVVVTAARLREALPYSPAQDYFRDWQVVELNATTEGQAVSALAGVEKLPQAQPVWVTACDHGAICDWTRVQRKIDEGVDILVFGAENFALAERFPNAYAYVKHRQRVVEGVSVKQKISERPAQDTVLIGTFYFKSAALLGSLIQDLLASGQKVHNEYYLDSVLEFAVRRGLKVEICPVEYYIPWGTPPLLSSYEYWHSYLMGDAGPRFPSQKLLESGYMP